MTARCFSLLVVLVAVGCTRSIAVVLPPQTLTVMVYAQGKVAQHCQVPPDSDQFRKLGELLRQSPDGWHKGFGSYPLRTLAPFAAVIGFFALAAMALLRNDPGPPRARGAGSGETQGARAAVGT